MGVKVLKFKNGIVALALISFLVGCGGGSNSNESAGGGGDNVPTGTYTVNVT